MKLNKTFKKGIHFNYVSKLLFNNIKIKNLNISLKNLTLTFTNILNKLIFFFKKVSLQMSIFISNSDKRLLIREINTLSFLLKIKILFKSNKNIKKRKKIDFLRSPFISSKSKEHLGFNKFIINLKIDTFFNLFEYLFLKEIKKYIINYSIIKFKTILI